MYGREIPIQNVWERNPHTKCMGEKSPYKMYGREIPIQKMYERNPHTKYERSEALMYFVWERPQYSELTKIPIQNV